MDYMYHPVPKKKAAPAAIAATVFSAIALIISLARLAGMVDRFGYYFLNGTLIGYLRVSMYFFTPIVALLALIGSVLCLAGKKPTPAGVGGIIGAGCWLASVVSIAMNSILNMVISLPDVAYMISELIAVIAYLVLTLAAFGAIQNKVAPIFVCVLSVLSAIASAVIFVVWMVATYVGYANFSMFGGLIEQIVVVFTSQIAEILNLFPVIALTILACAICPPKKKVVSYQVDPSAYTYQPTAYSIPVVQETAETVTTTENSAEVSNEQ